MLIDLSILRSIAKPSASVARRVLIINGHPDPRPERFCAALCGAFEQGIRTSGNRVRSLSLGEEAVGNDMDAGLERLWWANRLFIAYPMWLGGPPPALRRLFEAFASQISIDPSNDRRMDAQVVVTASLPSFLYRPHTPNGKRSTILPILSGIEIAS